MKKLTLSRVAAASIRANRKSYRSLAVGIFLAVYLAAAVTLCFYGIWQAHERQICRYMGKTDCVLFDESGLSDDRLRDSGLFSQIGHLVIKAAVKDSDIYLAYADEDAAEILGQEVLEGRLPERAGEIALERGVLQKLRLNAQVGDTLRLTLSTINGEDEERELTLVGILFKQSERFQANLWYRDSRRVNDWPSALISPEEAFAGGRTAVHRVMRYAALATTDRVEAYFNEGRDNWDRYNFFGVDRNEGVLVGSYSNDSLGDNYSLLKQYILFLGAALLLVVGIGIATAMESVLDAKTEEIGLLRAVGATRRQIRRVFGRETWLLGLVSLPGALLLAVLTEWLLARLAPEQLCFGVPLWLLLPIVLFAALSIALSAAYPLWRASRQLPMGVLRDTTLLRKAKGFRSRQSFSVSRLIALRQLRLRPWRQLGAALMLCLSLLMLAALPSALDGWGDWLGPETIDDFNLWPRKVLESHNELSEQDLAQLRAIEHVKTVTSRGATTAHIVLEGEPPAYLQPFYTDENGNIARAVDPYAQSSYGSPHVSVQVYVTDSVADLDEAVLAEGVIDWDAIDRGEQILVYAPECFAFPQSREYIDRAYILQEGMPYDCTYDSRTYELYGSLLGKPAAHIENDFFHAGQALSLVQFIVPRDDFQNFEYSTTDWLSAAQCNEWGTEKRQFDLAVGAVLSRFPQGGHNVTLITSFAGARALGLGGIYTTEIGVSLDGSVDAETEKEIEERLTDIALRGDMDVINWVEAAREARENAIRGILLIGCVLLLFTATAIAMQVSGADRSIRADARKIGTLRAVGANEKTLRRCYFVPMLFGIGLGAVLALVLARWWIIKVFDWGSMPALVYPLLLLFAALCALCCFVALRLRLKRVLNRSIVENIREL